MGPRRREGDRRDLGAQRAPVGGGGGIAPLSGRRWIAEELSDGALALPQLVDRRLEHGAWIVDRTCAHALALAEVAVCIEERSVPERVGVRWIEQRVDRALARHARARGAGHPPLTPELLGPLAESVGLAPQDGAGVVAAIARLPVHARRALRELARGEGRPELVRTRRVLAPALVAVAEAASSAREATRDTALALRLEPFERGLGDCAGRARVALAFVAAVDVARRGAPELRVALEAFEALLRRRDLAALDAALDVLVERRIQRDSFVRLRGPRRAPSAERLEAALRRAGRRPLPLADDDARLAALLGARGDGPGARLWRLRADYGAVDPARSAAGLAALFGEHPGLVDAALEDELGALWLDAGDPARASEACGGRGRVGALARAALEGPEPLVADSPRSTQRERATIERDARSSRAFGASALRVFRFAGFEARELYRDSTLRVAADTAVAPELGAALRRLRADAAAAVQPARGGLDPDARWMALEPVLDGAGRCVGAVVLEWRHGPLASPAARRALAAAWSARTAARGDPLPCVLEVDRARDAARLRSVAERAVSELGLGLAHRRWCLVALRQVTDEGLELELVGGGGAAALAPRPLGEGRGLALALASEGGVELARDPARLALHRGADGRPPASGVALSTSGLPIERAVQRGHGVFVFVLESTRRGDLGRADLTRLRERWRALHARLDFADLSDFGGGAPRVTSLDVLPAPDDPGHTELARAARRLARARAPVAVYGALGSGRAALARWIDGIGRRRAELRGGAGQVDVRVLARHPRALAAAGELALRDAVALSARCVGLPSLGEARHRIPGLVRALERRVFEDDALAELWRAELPAGLHDLSAVLSRIGDEDGPPVTARDVRLALGSVGLEPRERWPSRGVEAREVASALWCTRTAGGRVNRTRAALWLGWDPETLRARQEDLELPDVAAALRCLESRPHGAAGPSE